MLGDSNGALRCALLIGVVGTSSGLPLFAAFFLSASGSGPWTGFCPSRVAGARQMRPPLAGPITDNFSTQSQQQSQRHSLCLVMPAGAKTRAASSSRRQQSALLRGSNTHRIL
jgi:hypothetical protein